MLDSIWVYKLVRGYHILFYIVTELLMEYNESDEESPPTLKFDKRHLVWIIVMMEYLYRLFDVVLEREMEMHEKRRRKRIRREKKRMMTLKQGNE